MPKLFRRMNDVSRFEEDLFFERLESERARVRAIIATGLAACAFWLFLLLVPPAGAAFERGVGGPFPITALLALLGGVVAYEVAILVGLGYLLRRRLRVPDVPFFGNALVEVTFVSAAMWIVAAHLSPAAALNAPPLLVYTIIIALSTLRLSFALSVFTGLCAAIEYLVASAFLLADSPPAGALALIAGPAQLTGKAVLLAVSGIFAGFVGVQLRKRIVAALDLVEERNRIHSVFGQYISPAVVERLLDRGAGTQSEVRRVAVLFLDIRNFTRFAESREPERVLDHLNSLFGPMIAIVNRHHGMINKFLGDGFMAVFGAPITHGDDAENAMRAGLELIACVRELSAAGTIEETHVGIGIHAGDVVTGPVGSEERKEYTIIGDTVNLASRVEQLNKEVGSQMLVTEELYRSVESDVEGERLPPFTVKGRNEPVVVYRVA